VNPAQIAGAADPPAASGGAQFSHEARFAFRYLANRGIYGIRVAN